MTYWEQECGDKSLKQKLEQITNNDDVAIMSDEKELFRALKRHLTRKELHAFCMKEGKATNEEISKRVSVKLEDVDLLLKKAERKLSNAKVTKEIFVKKED